LACAVDDRLILLDDGREIDRLRRDGLASGLEKRVPRVQSLHR